MLCEREESTVQTQIGPATAVHSVGWLYQWCRFSPLAVYMEVTDTRVSVTQKGIKSSIVL